MFNRDRYSHPVPGVNYILEAILGPGGDREAFYTWFQGTCDCLDYPCLLNCTCIKRYGQNYEASLLTSQKLMNESSIYECSAFCSCNDECPNKVVQRGPNPYLQIRNIENKGLGVVALNKLRAGTFIAEYAGEIISLAVAEQRHEENHNNKYIMIMREHYEGSIIETCIDAYTNGNIARYINHSCSPNCVIIPVRTGCLVPKAAIFTTREISENEEICYAYGRANAAISQTKCYCGSINCRGFLPADVLISAV